MADAGEYTNTDQKPSRPRWKSQNLNAGHVRRLSTRQVASLMDSEVVNNIKVCVKSGMDQEGM